MDAPPTSVAIVLPPFVRLHHVTSAATEALADVGLSLERDSAGFLAVRFAASPEPLLANSSFVDTFARLTRAGIAFAEDYTQDCSPAAIMRQLQADGRVSGAFTSLAWRGTDGWSTTSHCESTNI